MLKLKSIRFKNFLSYGNSWSEIDLTDGSINIITARNGQGKTVIINAICYNLFGKTFSNIKLSKLVNTINGKNLITESEFEINGSSYKVIRGMKPSIFEIYKDGKLVNEEACTRDYQKYLESVIGFNHTTFLQTTILGTASYIPFCELTAAQRRVIVEQILSIGVFSTMNQLLKSRSQQNTEALTENGYSLKNVKVQINAEAMMIKSLKEQHERGIEKINDQIEETNKKIKEKLTSIEQLNANKEKIDPYISSYEDLKKAKTEIAVKQNSIQSELKKLKKDNSAVLKHSTCPMCKQDISDEYRKHIQDEMNEKIEFANKQLEDYSNDLNSILKKEEKFIKLIDSWNNINNKLTVDNTELSILNNELIKLTNELKNPPSKDEIILHEQNVKELATKAKDLLESKEHLLNEKLLISQASEMLKDSGIKAMVIKQYIPIINKMINHYLREQEFYITFTLDENFNETIKARDRDDFSYQNLSQGERRRLDLAILFTWRYIASIKNSCSTNLLCADEILDSSLDSEGADSALKLFRNLKDSNVFIISHRTEIQDSLFDNVYTVQKKNQFSTITKN